MRICLVGNPQATHTQRWATALGDKDHDVHVVGIRNAVIENATVHTVRKGEPQSSLDIAASYLRLGLRLRSLVAEIEPDVVLAHYTTTNGLLARLARVRPLVVLPWGTDIREERQPWKRWLRNRLNAFVLRRADAIVVSSHYLEGRVLTVTSGGCSPPVVIPFGVEPARFKPNGRPPDPKQFRIGFIKHFRARYGTSTLLDAMPSVLAALPNASLVLAGSGPLESSLRDQTARLGIGDCVEFVGRIPHADVPELMASLDVLVNPSLEESFGVVLLEAASTAVPAISSDVGGVREIVKDGVTGLLVPAGDPDALAASIIRLGRQAEFRQQLGAAARRRAVATFDWNTNVATLEALLQSLAEPRPRPRLASVRSLARRLERLPLMNRALRPTLVRLWNLMWSTVIRLRMRRSGPIHELSLDVGCVAVDLRDRGVAWPLVRYREYEPAERSIMRQLVEPGMTAIDIGAQIGYHTLLLSDLVGDEGRVLAIEAAPDNYDLLCRNLNANDATNVAALNLAAADHAGEVLIGIDPQNLGAHHIVRDSQDGNTVAVAAQTVDALADELQLSPDFLKMDIEGAEVSAIRGMSRVLAGEDVVLLAELNRPGLERAGESPEGLLIELERLGYTFFLIDGDGGLRRSEAQTLLEATVGKENVNFVAARGAALIRIDHAGAV